VPRSPSLVRVHFPHVALLSLLISACETPAGTAAAVIGGVTIVGGRTPANELEQTYYVGVFDPLKQLPPAVYRLKVRGQASAVSSMRFASGWVPAAVVDGLNERVGFDENGRVKVESAEASASAISPSRRLMMFGPEGFREAPKDHRLVIVMSSSPEAFFDLARDSLRTVVQAQLEQIDSATSLALLSELQRLRDEQRELDKLSERVAAASRAEEK
jgi:hypothetical protein